MFVLYYIGYDNFLFCDCTIGYNVLLSTVRGYGTTTEAYVHLLISGSQSIVMINLAAKATLDAPSGVPPNKSERAKPRSCTAPPSPLLITKNCSTVRRNSMPLGFVTNREVDSTKGQNINISSARSVCATEFK